MKSAAEMLSVSNDNMTELLETVEKKIFEEAKKGKTKYTFWKSEISEEIYNALIDLGYTVQINGNCASVSWGSVSWDEVQS